MGTQVALRTYVEKKRVREMSRLGLCGGTYSEDDVRPVSDVSNCRRSDINNHKIANPITSRRNRRSSLPQLQREDFRRINPNRSLESNRKRSLENKQHSSSACSACSSDCGFVLDVPD